MSGKMKWSWVLLFVPLFLLASCSGMTRIDKSCNLTPDKKPTCSVKKTLCKSSDLPVETEMYSFVSRTGKLVGTKTTKTASCSVDEFFDHKKNPKVPKLVFPIENGTLSSGFGYRRGVFHSGLDVAACKGEPIKACSGGKVLFTGSRKGYRSYGQMVILDHGKDVCTQYAHLSKIVVKRGQKVDAGDTIGLVGSTGRSTSPHLHLEVRVGSQVYNPLAYFKPDQLKEIEVAKSFTATPMGPVSARKR